MKVRHSFKGDRCAAFSLIEVTIAMAIAAVAVVSLLGLVPQGMNTMRDAGDEAITARIHQQILNELQMADFEVIDSYNDMEIFFDGQGEEIGDNRGAAGAKGSFSHIYSARISILDSGGGKLPDSVGGGTFAGLTLDGKTHVPSLKTVLIEVAAVAGLGAQFDWSEKYSNMINTFQTTVVKMGRTFDPAGS